MIILFDVGGVLVNRTENLIYDAIADEYEIDFKSVYVKIHKSLGDFEKGKISGREHANRFYSIVGKKKKPVHYLWDCVYQENSNIDKKMMNLAKNLMKEHTVGILSNTIAPHYNYNVKRKLFKGFSPVFVSNKMGFKKPRKNCYKHVIKKCGTKNIIFIDDKKENIGPARACGIDAIHFIGYDNLRKELKKRNIMVT